MLKLKIKKKITGNWSGNMKDLKTGAYIEKCKTGISYFWIETLTGKAMFVELTALNRRDEAAKNWIAFRAFDEYKN